MTCILSGGCPKSCSPMYRCKFIFGQILETAALLYMSVCFGKEKLSRLYVSTNLNERKRGKGWSELTKEQIDKQTDKKIK